MKKTLIMKHITFIITFIVFISCSSKVLLNDGYTKVPSNPKVFNNRIYFNKSVLAIIDTNAIYEEFQTNQYNGFEKQQNILARHNYQNSNTVYGVYKFYSNGNINLFYIDRTKPELTAQTFDPALTGWRGVLYTKKNKILGDIFTQTGQMNWQAGIQTYEFSVVGDTLFVELKNLHKYSYVKRKIDPTILNHNTNW